MKVAREFHYDAAHRLPLVPEGHKCSRLHGHTYRLIVIIDGPVQDNGFVIDFADIDRHVETLLKANLDHYYLNDVEGLDNPTVEIQLEWLWAKLQPTLRGLTSLRLYEGLNNWGELP